MNVEEHIAVCIKSFNRPKKLFALINSIRKYYKKIEINVVDDSIINIPFTDINDCHVKVHILECKNMGVSYGRNYIINKTKKDYILFLDDDHIFHNNTSLEKMIKLFSLSDKVGVVGGVVGERCVEAVYQGGSVFIKDGVLYKQCNDNFFEDYLGVKYRFCTLNENFLLIKRNLLKYVQWDNNLKTAEHVDFFLSLKKSKWKLIFCPEVSILHDHDGYKIGDEYSLYRYEKYGKFKKLFWNKWEIISDIYLNIDGTVQQRWITPNLRIKYDSLGKILSYSNHLMDYLLCKAIRQNHLYIEAEIISKNNRTSDVLDVGNVVSFKIENSKQIEFDNCHYYLVKMNKCEKKI